MICGRLSSDVPLVVRLQLTCWPRVLRLVWIGARAGHSMDSEPQSWPSSRMALDYNNLPLLLTVDEVAELLRCSIATVRQKLKRQPGWLKPTRTALMRRQLFATSDVLLVAGIAGAAAAPVQTDHNPWDRKSAADALDRAAKEREREQWAARSRRYEAKANAWRQRVREHPPSARLVEIGRHGPIRFEQSGDSETFKLTLYFQPRFRPEGWPGQIPIPRKGPEWLSLETDEEMNAVIVEVEEIMAEYRPRREQQVHLARIARAAEKAAMKSLAT